jgi:hypothetical protein
MLIKERKKERRHDVDIESIVVVDFRPILYNSGEREKNRNRETNGHNKNNQGVGWWWW